MAESIKVLRGMTDDELIAKHDLLADYAPAGFEFFRNELERRERARATASSNNLARWAFWMTCANTLLAVVAVVVAIAGGD